MAKPASVALIHYLRETGTEVGALRMCGQLDRRRSRILLNGRRRPLDSARVKSPTRPSSAGAPLGGPRKGADEPDFIVVRGAREHNLNIDQLRIPKRSLVVFTGVSGSGKSSLAFDTLYAEGQRRYVESLSSYARQFLGQMINPTSTRSTGCLRRSQSTRRVPVTTRAPPSAR